MSPCGSWFSVGLSSSVDASWQRYEWPTGPGSDESAAVVAADPRDDASEDYAAAKRGDELAVEEAFGGRSVLARAGLILGPYENIGRLPWWLNRMRRGGLELAGLHDCDTTAAIEAGLRVRPVTETVADTWRWLQTEGLPPVKSGRVQVGLDPAIEVRLLRRIVAMRAEPRNNINAW